MHTWKRRSTLGLALVVALAMSGVALAAPSEGDNTVINHGYDEGSHFWIINVVTTEFLDPEGDPGIDDLLEMCGLGPIDAEDDPIEYEYSYDGESLTVTGPEGEITECGDFFGGDISGPAGQVNHGMFMKWFNQNYNGEHRGCIVSQIAHLGLGKDTQQVKAGENESDEVHPTVEEPLEGTISFETLTARCHIDSDELGEDGRRGNGPPQHVLDKFGGQHPKDAKGKSGHGS